jgi:hypothetical protein
MSERSRGRRDSPAQGESGGELGHEGRSGARAAGRRPSPAQSRRRPSGISDQTLSTGGSGRGAGSDISMLQDLERGMVSHGAPADTLLNLVRRHRVSGLGCRLVASIATGRPEDELRLVKAWRTWSRLVPGSRDPATARREGLPRAPEHDPDHEVRLVANESWVVERHALRRATRRGARTRRHPQNSTNLTCGAADPAPQAGGAPLPGAGSACYQQRCAPDCRSRA